MAHVHYLPVEALLRVVQAVMVTILLLKNVLTAALLCLGWTPQAAPVEVLVLVGVFFVEAHELV